MWATITSDRTFWRSLPTYYETVSALGLLNLRIQTYGDDVYFITNRPGINAKLQTEEWLRRFWPTYQVPTITVLISSAKGLCASALQLDKYIDDRYENVADVVRTAPQCWTYLLSRPWNLQYSWKDRVTSMQEMFSPSSVLTA